MLAANEAVARRFVEKGWPALWRVHAQPDPDRLAEFSDKAVALGARFDADGVTPKRVRAFLESLRGHASERPLNFLLLRALSQAAYDVDNVGHFGLAAREYLHFTSPIRRYADTTVHRQLRAHLGWPGGGRAATRADLSEIAAETSRAERRAVEVERDVVNLFRAYLMRDRLGDRLEGVVTGVAPFGLFVEIDEPFVEGLVRVEKMKDDFYELDDLKLYLRGKRTGKAFTLGDRIAVRVESVSVARRKIELAPAWEAAGPRGEAPEPRPKKKHATRSRAEKNAERAARFKRGKRRS